MAQARFHVFIDGNRTTVTMPAVLSELLALKRGAVPKTPEAHGAVREWLQAEIDQDPGAVKYGRASQRLNQQAILAVAAPGLIAKRDSWMIVEG